MLARYAKAFVTRILTPIARALLAAGVSPDVITIIGTVGVSTAALVFFPRGEFLTGTLVIVLFVFSDTLDGTMARLSGRSSVWGAFLDSTMDRIADACIFAALLWWYVSQGDQDVLAGVTLVCLIGGMVISYAKARAEGLGMTANVGIAERSERLVAVLVATGMLGLSVPYVAEILLWALAVATVITVFQRMAEVRRQARAAEAA